MRKPTQLSAEWGTPRAHDIARRHALQLSRAGIHNSYQQSLEAKSQQRLAIDKKFDGAGYRQLGALLVAEIMDLRFPLLAVGLDRESLLARHHTIAQLGLAKVDPTTGAIIVGTPLWHIAEGEDRDFQVLDDSFTYSQVTVLLNHALELQSSRLYAHLPESS